ncbi:Golgi SNAP receptor complex member 1 [Kappamyces sp. JEL0680]|nr:Golgi SNAP receptor complex member 1 [Kappamyces sp. JEL0680]
MSYRKVATYEDQSEDQLPSWEYLRKEARSLEQQIDSRLISFASAAASSHQSNEASALTVTQQELTLLLSNLEKVTNQMQDWTLKTPSLTHLHSRHLANLYEYNREFNKTRANIQQQRDHSELLSGGIYSRNNATYSNQLGRMENSHNAVDEILQYDAPD